MHSSGEQRLVVVGAGGHARETFWLARECATPWNVVACLDDDETLHGQEIDGVPIAGPVDQWLRFADAHFVVAIGSPRARRTVVQRMASGGAPRFATLVHRSVLHPASLTIGAGTMVAAGCVLTTQVQVGSHAIVNIACTLSHDAQLDDFATLAPGVALPGHVRVEAGAEIAVGACLRQGLRIGRGALVGMGAVVTRDVAAGDVVVGNPARLLRRLDPF
jgi:sugar O-acyltransferase (sialic acid O-acetyltransferase NeuD family)